MRDYDGIAYALKGHTHDTAGDSCSKCPIDMHGRYDETCFNRLLLDAAGAIEELVAAVPKWISVEERLPEQYKPVLVTYLGFNTKSLISDMIAYLDGDGDWCWWDGDFPSGELCVVNITHWMPLPNPPKEVE